MTDRVGAALSRGVWQSRIIHIILTIIGVVPGSTHAVLVILDDA